MKKIALLLLALLAASPAQANVPCSVPFQLQNNTTADATQVMANYNALITCLLNAAAAGANNDITSLNALSTPITPAMGGTQMYVGGPDSAGSGNAHVVGTTTPANFTLTAGKQVTFVATLSNNGPTTLNVASTGVTNVFRRTQLGISAMVGGEIIVGHPITVEYDGTQFVCLTCGSYLVGEIRDFAGSSAPTGWAFIDGSCQVRATYADLFSVIGTTYDPTGSTCDVAHFALPDGRGRVLAGQDNMGGITIGRITNAGSSCVGTTLGGAGCGAQNVTLAQANLPNVTIPITDPGHFHVYQQNLTTQSLGTGGNATVQLPLGNVNTSTNTTGITATNSINGGVAQTTVNKLPPLQIVTKIIKL